jgi:nucleolar protein 53
MDSKEYYDLWNDAPPTKPTASSTDSDVADYFLRQTRKKQPKKFVPKSKKRSPDILVVEPPHPGASYNPALDDHLVLMHQAGEAEKKKIKAERRIERALELPPGERWVTPEIKLKEAREGLDPTESSDEDETDQTNVSYRPAIPAISAENRKLLSVRKKEKLRKKQELEKKKEKTERIRQSEIYRLRSIKKDIKKTEEQRSKKKEQSRQRKEALAKVQPPKLSRVRYEAPEAELQLRTELRGSLLELKPEGSLLEDRYKSLQKRGVVEPRTKQNHRRKHKLKKYEKRSHRDMPEGYLPR